MKTVLRNILRTAPVTMALVLPAMSRAHHSFAMYDMNVEKSFTGKLTRFIVGANHSQFIFAVVDQQGNPVKDAEGNTVTWGAETGPASGIALHGITMESFPIGTIFSVTVSPLRDGRNFGTLKGGIVLCGVTMPTGGCTRDSGKAYLDRMNYAAPAPNANPAP